MTLQQQRWLYGLINFIALAVCVALIWLYIAVYNEFPDWPKHWRTVLILSLQGSGALVGLSLVLLLTTWLPHLQKMQASRLFVAAISFANLVMLLPNTYTFRHGSLAMRQERARVEQQSSNNIRKANPGIWLAEAGFFPVTCNGPNTTQLCFGTQLQGDIWSKVTKAVRPTGEPPVWKLSAAAKAPSDYRTGTTKMLLSVGYGVEAPIPYRVEYGERNPEISIMTSWPDKAVQALPHGVITEREKWLRWQVFHRYLIFTPLD